MRLLVDTHLLQWAVASSSRLPRGARTLIEGPANEVYNGTASADWETSRVPCLLIAGISLFFGSRLPFVRVL